MNPLQEVLKHKPDCKCIEELIQAIKEKNGIDKDAFVYFRDQNILNGSLTNVVLIEEEYSAKSGKKRTKNSRVYIAHTYCPFCGRPYLNNKWKQSTSRRGVHLSRKAGGVGYESPYKIGSPLKGLF